MAIMIRDKITENSKQFLRPDEPVVAVMVGQRISGWWGALTYLWIFWNRYEAVVVTNQRILVLDCGKWTQGTPRKVLRELPRATRIGPPSGLWWKCTTLGDKLYIHKRFHKDVIHADAMLPVA
ncbi:hypothetical protein [Aeromicrobium wangtongii]|uniref:hypothetical protein n=1 Tax=Aeromicrobium wangtongii TaxID=2969247 RepID=UPI002016AC8E|nr:hypothetical protein [Aeromicrobium wangtongii]MCL3817444.1 hypothetical protein [Aeromicrobium wangtongii]